MSDWEATAAGCLGRLHSCPCWGSKGVSHSGTRQKGRNLQHALPVIFPKFQNRSLLLALEKEKASKAKLQSEIERQANELKRKPTAASNAAARIIQESQGGAPSGGSDAEGRLKVTQEKLKESQAKLTESKAAFDALKVSIIISQVLNSVGKKAKLEYWGFLYFEDVFFIKKFTCATMGTEQIWA